MDVKPTAVPTVAPDQALLPTDQLGAETTAIALALTPDEQARHVERWLQFLENLEQRDAVRAILEPIPFEPYTDTPVPAGYSVAVRANTSGIRLADPPSISTRTREDLLRDIAEHGVAVERAPGSRP